MSDWPPIPTLLRGAGGPITVRKRKKPRHKDGDEVWGLWDGAARRITIDSTAKIEHQWLVLFHELTHAALHDAGVENLMDDAGVEAICDAMATARIQEMRGELGVIDS